MVGKIFLAHSSAIKQVVIVWGVQFRVLARRDVIVRANRNKDLLTRCHMIFTLQSALTRQHGPGPCDGTGWVRIAL